MSADAAWMLRWALETNRLKYAEMVGKQVADAQNTVHARRSTSSFTVEPLDPSLPGRFRVTVEWEPDN